LTFTSQIDKTIEHEIPKNFIDIFAGAGGLTTGLEEAGLIATAAVDNNRQAILTYAENHPKTKVWGGDVGRFLGKKTNEKNLNNLEKIDVVVGCPPNQIWLLENKDSQKKQEENIKNINTLLKITNLYNPKIFMVELYIDMLKPKEEALVKMIITKLLKSGYQTRTDIINASYYGIPQRRISTIIYGIRNGLQMIGELKQTHKLKDNKEVIFNQ
jgi:DNA (cytosine-5)-methyltransferase 1